MNAWPMIQQCWLAQWRGFTSDEQEYMIQEAERGHPTFIALGHAQYNLWAVDHFSQWSSYPLPRRSGENLISVKVDLWPEQFWS